MLQACDACADMGMTYSVIVQCADCVAFPNLSYICLHFTRSMSVSAQLVLLRCHFFQGRSVSVGVSVKKSVVGLGFGVYTCVPSATVWLTRRIFWSRGRSG